jgi:glyoxylase-like metal-dependent hydrolase (beta-lactamase superfamily II)
MKIADNIEMLEIPMKLMGTTGTIYPTVIWDDEHVVLIDAGILDSKPLIKAEMDKAGLLFDKIDTILVTHQDIDHICGINSIVSELGDIQVLAHTEEKPYIQGEKPILRFENSNIRERITLLPEEEQQKILDMVENTSVKVDGDLTDDEVLNFAGGIVVIHTPGHTPGHICFYHQESKTLVVGDALNIEGNDLVVTHREAMSKKELEIIKGWLEKLCELNIENVIAYHTGLFNDNPNQKIRELTNSI